MPVMIMRLSTEIRGLKERFAEEEDLVDPNNGKPPKRADIVERVAGLVETGNYIAPRLTNPKAKNATRKLNRKNSLKIMV